MKRILITGKSGYIANAFAKWAKDHEAVLPERLKVTLVSVREGAEEMSFRGYDVVLHTAGIAHVDVAGKESLREEYFRVNADLTAQCAKKAKEQGVRQFLFLSSIIVYGDSAPLGRTKEITRRTKPAPASFYGESKLRAEKYLSDLSDDSFGVCIFRLPMVYGPGCKGNYGRLETFARFLPLFPLEENARSAIRIDRLCERIYEAILSGETGLVLPQDPEYLCTSKEVQRLAGARGRRILLTRAFHPALFVLSRLGDAHPGFKPGAYVNKAFGNLTYARESAGMELPTAAVVTICRNSERELPRTIESVLNQTMPPAEYHLVDGGSTDRSLEIIESYRQRAESLGIRYVVTSEPDKGIYDAMNKGVARARARIVGILNAGDVYRKNAIRRSAQTFAQTGCDISFGDILIRKTNGAAVRKRARLRGFQTSRDWNHPTMFVRRSLLGNRPFACKGIHDDYALYLKLRKQGAKIVTIPKILAEFSMGGASNRKSLKASLGRIRDRYLYCYLDNGYSPLYLFECLAIEGVKVLL